MVPSFSWSRGSSKTPCQGGFSSPSPAQWSQQGQSERLTPLPLSLLSSHGDRVVPPIHPSNSGPLNIQDVIASAQMGQSQLTSEQPISVANLLTEQR